jgi:hypothetical protein
MRALAALYYRITLDLPVVVLIAMVALVAASAWYAQDFKLDASSDSLVLEGDADLRYYWEVRARYGSDDFLFVTYTPASGEMMSDATLADIARLRDELKALERVASVTTLLDVPLIDSPRASLNEVRRAPRTLADPDTDRALAMEELTTGPLYKDLIMSPDGSTTAMQVNFRRDETYRRLLEERESLRLKRAEEGLTPAEERRLAEVSAEFDAYSAELQDQQQADIAAVREILDRYRDDAELHLGGVPMIASDMIDFVRNDIRVFGAGVAVFLVVLLAVFFKQPRWVLVPMVICTLAGVAMVGFLGLVHWEVTVVSSNFISLMLIITLSLTVHLLVRYQELQLDRPEAGQGNLLRETVRSKVLPSLYTALTTMVAFGSLVISGIRPVIDFGWMMVVGVGLAFLLTFLVFPAVLTRLPLSPPVFRRHDVTAAVTGGLARGIRRFRLPTLVAYGVLVALAVAGITRLTVENRFIDYFKDDTEIHQGMLLIDRKLGGTTPLDVVIGPDQEFLDYLAEEAAYAAENPEAAEESEAGISGDSYWFNVFQLEEADRVHRFLEGFDETGKVLSIATTMEMLRMLNDDQPLDNITLSVMHQRLPDDFRETLFDPYMARDGNELRFAVRVVDSDPDLQRDRLLEEVRTGLVEDLGFEPGQVRLSGMLVLYNNVLQSLFRSQILTLSVVFLAIMGMLLVLFRNLRLAAIGVVPTVVAASLILGLMGWAGIPLDIMTITIAAITIGIGVDNSIHYLHRLREEYRLDGDYWGAIRRSHASVGRAVYYTSITVTLGFSILVLSNFIPTIYFGLLTGLAMVAAFVANLTLLPLLAVWVRPLRGEG